MGTTGKCQFAKSYNVFVFICPIGYNIKLTLFFSGLQIGFMYHSVVEDNLTGFCMHCKGWISVYINPSRPAFLGSAPANLSDCLIQTIRWYSGLLQVGFSKFCPLIYGPLRMSLLQSMVYASYAFQALSALPMLCYAIVPQLCLLTGIALYPKVRNIS